MYRALCRLHFIQLMINHNMSPQEEGAIKNSTLHLTPSMINIIVGALVVLAIGIFTGIEIAHGNSDYVCSQSYSDSQQGACTGGSWGSWTNVNGTLQRTYTGTQTTVNYSGAETVSCSHPTPSGIANSSGTVTTQYSACQIVETGTAANNGNNGTVNNNNSANTGSTGTQTVTVTSQSVTTGAFQSSSQANGSYANYQAAAEAALASADLTVVPGLVRSGNTTQVIWTSDHVKSCTVTGTNGDTWTELASPVNGETSSPITGQTTYTLVCTTAIGTQKTSSSTVNIIPAYREQ